MIEEMNEEAKPWYKQFWAWFILSPLILVWVACSITVTIAVKNRDDIVIGNYYKEGRMINQRFEQDEHAKALHLKGELVFDRLVGEVWLQISGDKPLPDQLQLTLDNPAKESMDQTLTLVKTTDGRYRADLSEKLENRWYILILPHEELTIAEAQWRLVSEINFNVANNVRFNVND